MARELFDYHDVVKRLDRTVCMLNNVPVFIRASEREGRKIVLYKPLSKVASNRHDWLRSDYTGSEFSYKSPLLGYFNNKDSCYYLARCPERKQRQGLSHDSVFSHTGYRIDQAEMLSESFADCITGDYPSLTKCIEIASEPRHSQAFARHWALGYLEQDRAYPGLALSYRGERIGRYDHKSNLVRVNALYDGAIMKRLISELGFKYDTFDKSDD